MSSQPAASRRSDADTGLWIVATLAVGVAAFAIVVWVAACANTLVVAGRLPHLDLGGALHAGLRLASAPGSPSQAFQADAAAMAHSAVAWYLVALIPTIAVGAAISLTALGGARHVGGTRRAPLEAQRLGRVPLVRRDGTGRRARLRFFRASPGRVVLGRAGAGIVCAEDGVHVCVVAPPGQHKTTGVVIPALLEWPGPLIALSTKPDLLDAAAAHRRRLGDVRVYDPFGAESCGWTPLSGCTDWQATLARAHALTNAAKGRLESAAGVFWDRVARGVLAPMLHAAALGRATIGDAYDWISRADTHTAAHILTNAGSDDAQAALRELDAVAAMHEENRSNTWISAKQLLEAYRYPTVLRHAAPELTPDWFLAPGQANTLFIVASDTHQELLRPVVVAIVDELYTACFAAGRVRRLDPPVLFCLDEAANVAPLRGLPAYLSQSRAAGITWLTVWQSLAQIHARYGDEADTILNTSLAKLFASGSSDPHTIDYLRRILGPPTDRDTAPLDPRLLDGRLLCLYKDHPAFALRPRAWFDDRRLRRLAKGAG